MSMITAVSWVPRGYAAQFPSKYVFDEEEYERISKLAKLELDDAKEDLAEVRAEESRPTANGSVEKSVNGGNGAQDHVGGDSEIDIHDDDLKEYDLEHYDDEDAEDTEDGQASGTLPMFSSARSLAYHTSNAEDPYITIKEDEASDDEEREELEIFPTDNLVLAAKVEDEVAHLEIYVYEDSADNLYVHHDIMLPAIPLAVEWINTPVNRKTTEEAHSGKANFVAVGTMDPEIEIWDLDLVDSMYPNAVLGSPESQASLATTPSLATRKKKRKSKEANANHHVDSVLSLASSRPHPHLLASASADTTVKLWDLTKLACAQSYNHHTDKVCSLAWHPTTTTVLLSGSYDRTLIASDMRAPTSSPPKWGVESDVETLAWDPHDPNYFYTSTESGILHCFDSRSAPFTPGESKAVWRLQAHEKSLSCFSVNPVVPGFIATGSTDKTVKLWDTQSATGAGPSMVVSRNVDVGRVFGVQFAPDQAVGFRLAVAGSRGDLQVWDTSTNRAVREAFGTRVKGGIEDRGVERVVKVRDETDSEEEERDDGEGGGQDGWESMEE